MGMYNEVFVTCPECKIRNGYAQIGQIILGFGGFNLDNPDDLAERLSGEEIADLREKVTDLVFRCECGNVFTPFPSETHEDKAEMAKRLFDR